MSRVEHLEPLAHAPVSRLQLVKYAGASGDFNPIHWDDSAARDSGLDGVIAHGMLSMGLVGEYVTAVAAGATVRRLSARFRSMVSVGDVLICRGTAVWRSERERHLDLSVETQDGRVVVTAEADLVDDEAGRAQQS